MNIGKRIREAIRDVADFPKPGIIFKDITPILEDAQLSGDIIKAIAESVKEFQVDAVAGVESRGFLFGMPLAIAMGVPFITIRKKGKLPYKTVSYKYDLEYGSAEIEVHEGSIKKGWNVLIHDDLLATGGTAAATAELVKSQEAEVAAFSFLVELEFLKGTERLTKYGAPVQNLVSY